MVFWSIDCFLFSFLPLGKFLHVFGLSWAPAKVPAPLWGWEISAAKSRGQGVCRALDDVAPPRFSRAGWYGRLRHGQDGKPWELERVDMNQLVSLLVKWKNKENIFAWAMYIRQGLSIHKMIGTSCKYIYRYKYLILDVLMWFCVGKHVKFTCIHINQNQTQQKSQSIILMRCEEFKPLQTQNGNGWQWLPICMNDDPISCHIFQIDKRWSQAQRPSHHWSILRDMQEAQKVLHNFEDFRVSPFNKLHRTSTEVCMWFATMVIIKKTFHRDCIRSNWHMMLPCLLCI